MAENAGAVRSTSSTRLTLSKNSSQSMEDIHRMLLMMLRTVALAAPWAWCSSATTSLEDVPWAASFRSSQSRAGMIDCVLVAQPLDQLDCERPSQGGVVQTAQDVLGALGGPTGEAQQAVRQLVGPGPLPSRVYDQLRQPPQVLHECHAQVDRHGPELADAREAGRAGRPGRSAPASPARSDCRCGPRRPRPTRRRAEFPPGGPRRSSAAGGSSSPEGGLGSPGAARPRRGSCRGTTPRRA